MSRSKKYRLIAGSGRLLVDAGRTFSCLVNVVARSDTGVSASFLQRLVVKHVAGLVSLVRSIETIGSDLKYAGAAAWTMAITAGGTNDAPAVTGTTGLNIRWHAVVQSSEVVY